MAVLVEIARSVTRVIVMLTRHFVLPGLIAMTMLVEIARRVARVVVMLTGCFFWHVCSPWFFRTDSSSPTMGAALLSFSHGTIGRSRCPELRQGFYNLMLLEDQGE